MSMADMTNSSQHSFMDTNKVYIAWLTHCFFLPLFFINPLTQIRFYSTWEGKKCFSSTSSGLAIVVLFLFFFYQTNLKKWVFVFSCCFHLPPSLPFQITSIGFHYSPLNLSRTGLGCQRFPCLKNQWTFLSPYLIWPFGSIWNMKPSSFTLQILFSLCF